MEFIIDFYKGLETLDLIIFWGIIIVIILLLIFSLILLNKNKKLKKIMNEKKDSHQQIQNEEIPIKNKEEIKLINEKQQIIATKINEIEEENKEFEQIVLPDIPTRENNAQESAIQTEKKFVAEEHVIEYNQDMFSLSNIKKTNENTEINKNIKPVSQMPTGPYQRNVLREMSLGQTSPIGITIPKKKGEEKIEIAKDLVESLNTEKEENISKNEVNLLSNKKESITINDNNQEEDKIIKKELTENKISSPSPRKTEIKTENSYLDKVIPKEKFKENKTPETINYKEQKIKKEEARYNDQYQERENITDRRKLYSEYRNEPKEEHTEEKKEFKKNDIDPRVKELLNNAANQTESLIKNRTSEKYLEEVSRKLAEAEIPDEVERTEYELEQEENAIISYKELMQKKDSIQTVDEEEAVISIEELMNRNNKKEEIKEQEEVKLYKLTDEEENDDFIKELKQFRNDL